MSTLKIACLLFSQDCEKGFVIFHLYPLSVTMITRINSLTDNQDDKRLSQAILY